MSIRTANEPILDKVGFTAIRLVIASYFVALSLGYVSGVNTGVIFQAWLAPENADALGRAMLAAGSFLLLLGYMLRPACLYLAVLVLASSSVENVILAQTAAQTDALWRDLIMVSALLLCYGTLTRQSMAQSSLIARRRKVRRITPVERVVPRRVVAAKSPPVPTLRLVVENRGTPAETFAEPEKIALPA